MKRTLHPSGVYQDKRMVRLSALLYLAEALNAEQYEVCSEIIEAAKASGSTDAEIDRVLETGQGPPL